ncbi:MAG: hypothetical protein ABI661_12485 [Gammaproteobacteria bacterium]
MKCRRHSALLLALFLALAGLATEAQAYLDPSTGSMILSAIVGLLATAGLAVKTFWYKLKNLRTRRAPASSSPQSPPQTPPERAGQEARAGQGNRPS